MLIARSTTEGMKTNAWRCFLPFNISTCYRFSCVSTLVHRCNRLVLLSACKRHWNNAIVKKGKIFVKTIFYLYSFAFSFFKEFYLVSFQVRNYVSQQTSKSSSRPELDGKKQCPSDETRLLKNLYFFPGISPDWHENKDSSYTTICFWNSFWLFSCLNDFISF